MSVLILKTSLDSIIIFDPLIISKEEPAGIGAFLKRKTSSPVLVTKKTSTSALAPVLFERGAVTSCALKFAGDPNTGIISPAADEISLVTGGSSHLTIDANGAAIFTGNVQVNGSLSVTGGFDSGENLALIIALG